jgi:hypothetical protein
MDTDVSIFFNVNPTQQEVVVLNANEGATNLISYVLFAFNNIRPILLTFAVVV